MVLVDNGFGFMTAGRLLLCTISVLFIAKGSVANGCVTVAGIIVNESVGHSHLVKVIISGS
jgi:hypothetical protein